MTVRLKQLILLFGDWALFYLALFLALWLRYQRNPLFEFWPRHWPIFSFVFFIWLIVFFLNDLYNLRRAKNNLDFFRSFLAALGLNFLLAIGFFYVINKPALSPKTILILLTAFYLPLCGLWRLLTHSLLKTATLKTRLLFLGLTEEGLELIKAFDREPQIGYATAAVVSDPTNPLLKELPPNILIVPSLDNLFELIKEMKIDTIVATTTGAEPEISRLLYQTLLSRVSVVNIASFYEAITHRIPLSVLSEAWFLENLKEGQKKFYDAAKRLIDIVLGVMMGLIFVVFLLPLSLVIYLFDRGPIFYHHRRVSRDGKIFTIYKFRTMIVGAEKNGSQFTKSADPRVTKIGKWLRLTRLDELPQTWNILKNEMSFIGPRPERPEFVSELEKMMPYYGARHLVKPGLTGWSQINYGYADTLEGNLTKLQYDLFYIKNRSLFLDGVILLKTIKTIVKGLGR